MDYDLQVELKEDEKPSLILYSYRWVVLFTYFLTSAATGVVAASLSTNRPIVMNIYKISLTLLQVAKYADLILYLPANFISTKVIEARGLRACVLIGSTLMLFGSILRIFSIIQFSSNRQDMFWPFFIGQIICVSGQAFLKNPVSKLATNWFGDRERGIATGVGIMATPSGIFISNFLISTFLEDSDKLPENVDRATRNYDTFIIVNTAVVCGLVLPAIFLIRDKPPSPPSIIATKPRPNFTFWRAT